jgi:mycothiol synthase
MATLQLQDQQTLVKGYFFRPATMDDLVPVADLLNAWSQHYLGIRQFDAADLGREWREPDFNLETSTRVAVTEHGQIVAYYEVWDQNNPPVRIHLWGRVHPSHENRGLGSVLIEWAVERARQALPRAPESARVTLGVGALAIHTAAHQLLEDHGFSLVRHYLRMVIDLHEPPAEPLWPEGITVRSLVRGQDERRVVQAVRDSFRDHWGWSETDFEEEYRRWRNHIAGNPEFDPGLWFLAEEQGQVAGVSLCWKKRTGEDDLGWVGTLGVLRPWRRRGLGLALLQHSFAALYQLGQRKVGLGVDAYSLTGATRLYEKAGMRSDPMHQIAYFELELRPGADLTTQQVEP